MVIVEDYEDQNGGYGCGIRKKEGTKIQEFCAAINVILGDTLIKKRTSHLVIYESSLSKAQVDHVLVKRK